ncbi:MAG: insulinase family protein, partial [candidate division Zixibacteria bacterium]|nr:insulinase family protein [candidate division Zixibacteria bacterium]
DYMRKHYHGDTLVISAAGNVNHSKLVRLVERKLKIGNGIRNSGGRRSYPRSYRAVKVTKRDSAQTHLCLGVPAVRYSHPDRLGVAVLNVLLGGGMSSRLFQTIRERLSLVYSIYSFLESYEDSGIWGIYLATDAGQLPRAIDYSLRELKKVKLNAVGRRELEDAKSQIKGNTVIGLESSSSRMHRLARNELYLRRYIPLDQTISDINKIKVDDIHRIAREMFRPENYSAAVLGPVKNGLGKSLRSDLNN